MVTTMEMPAAQFRVRFFELLDEVNEKNEEIVITKHGKPVAKIVPVRAKPKSSFGCMAGTGEILGDIESPCLPPIDEWGDPDIELT